MRFGRGWRSAGRRADDDVQAHQLVEALVVEAKHLAKVARIVERSIIGCDFAIKVGTAIYESAHLRNVASV